MNLKGLWKTQTICTDHKYSEDQRYSWDGLRNFQTIRSIYWSMGKVKLYICKRTVCVSLTLDKSDHNHPRNWVHHTRRTPPIQAVTLSESILKLALKIHVILKIRKFFLFQEHLDCQDSFTEGICRLLL